MFPRNDSPDSGYHGLSNMIDDFTMMDHQFKTEEEHVVVKKETIVHECHYCGLDITDRHLLKVGADQFWHLQCLRCSQCQIGLDDFGTCFLRDQNMYCRSCYTSEFASRCSACRSPVAAGDWVRRAMGYVYHLDCFACEKCQTSLSTGESFSMIGHRLRCKDHLINKAEPIVVKQEPIEEAAKAEDASSTCTSSSDDTHHSAESSPKRKRLRTSFTEHQLDVLRASFKFDENPDSVRMQSIADMTGLSKRVTQVWFQNARARRKKENTACNARVTNVFGGLGNFGMAQILNGTSAVGTLRYHPQIPAVFNFS